MTRTLLIILFCATGLASYAQPANDRLAQEYFRKGEYDKAVIYYEELYKNSGRNDYLESYTECLVQLDQVGQAIQVQKKAYKSSNYYGVYGVRLGHLYAINDDSRQAIKVWDDCIDRLDNNQSMTSAVARAFVAIGQNEYALSAYEYGRRQARGYSAFSFEIAELYGVMGRYEEMIDVYLNLIESNPAYIQTVQNMIGRNFDLSEPSEANDILKERILRKVQESPDVTLYGELIIWYFYQVGDFYSAFGQTKALDRRTRSGGRRVLDFARTSYNNERFALAIDAYEYVLEYGDAEPNLEIAERELLLCRYEYYNKEGADQTQWSSLEADFKGIELRYATNRIGGIYRKHAQILARHLGQTEKAIAMLEDLIATQGLPAKQLALAKIELADYLLLQDNIWDAALLYMQAEKEFKYDETGDLAKFKTAKLAYYTGDFQWAKAQLDVLKGSTSKLIANDAMNLSAFIDDNSAFDSVYTTLEFYARADLLSSQGHFQKASATLDSLESRFPMHRIIDDSYFLRYENALAQRDDTAAIEYLYKITNQNAEELLVDKAWFLIGVMQEEKFQNIEKAMEAFEKIIFEHPDSLYIVESRKRYRQLRGDTL